MDETAFFHFRFLINSSGSGGLGIFDVASSLAAIKTL